MEYIHCDSDVQCYGDLTESEIIDDIISGNLEMGEENENGTENDEDEEVEETPLLKEALKALNVIQKYCFHKNIDLSVDQIESEMLKGSIKSAKQSTIMDFFS